MMDERDVWLKALAAGICIVRKEADGSSGVVDPHKFFVEPKDERSKP